MLVVQYFFLTSVFIVIINQHGKREIFEKLKHLENGNSTPEILHEMVVTSVPLNFVVNTVVIQYCVYYEI